jgi:hypothetical protein
MENVQGNLGTNFTLAISTDCKTLTFTDANDYSGGSQDPPAKKFFWVRKHSDGNQIIYESTVDEFNNTAWVIDDYEYKDGYHFAYLLALPITIGEGGLPSEIDKGDLFFYQNISGSFKGFFIANINMGGTGECPVVTPENQTKNEWKEPTFDEFFEYINQKNDGCACAANIDFGYWEDFILCLSDIQRNDMLAEAECKSNCLDPCKLSGVNRMLLLTETLTVREANKEYKQGQEVVEQIEEIYQNRNTK